MTARSSCLLDTFALSLSYRIVVIFGLRSATSILWLVHVLMVDRWIEEPIFLKVSLCRVFNFFHQIISTFFDNIFLIWWLIVNDSFWILSFLQDRWKLYFGMVLSYQISRFLNIVTQGFKILLLVLLVSLGNHLLISQVFVLIKDILLL